MPVVKIANKNNYLSKESQTKKRYVAPELVCLDPELSEGKNFNPAEGGNGNGQGQGPS